LENLAFLGAIVGGAVIVLITIGIFIAKLYQRASKEQSFVRTGMGGQKVVKDGGAVVFPVFHEIIPINMQTLRLTVEKKDKESMITKDRLRINVKAEFYVRVAPDEASIAAAAQTLGRRTLQPQQLSELIEGKFVDVLRAVAAGMEMQDLHTQRADFVKQVQTTVAEDLKKNGLELESVSLTGLDQTSVEHFNPNNAFDAEGLAKLTSVTETRKKERNDIEQDNRIAIETKNLEANKRSLTIKQDQEFASLEQEREVETRRAAQEAELAQTRAERTREADIAALTAAQATAQAQVEKDRSVKVAETEAARDLEIAAQASRIAVAEKSEAESRARAAADLARAAAVEATEAVKTVEATAQAERSQKVAVIAAETKAQEEAAGIRIRAEAELQAADASAQAKERLIEADAKRYEVESEGQRALNEAGNVISNTAMAFNLRKALIEAMPDIIERMGKPIEKIDSFRVVQMGGMGQPGNGEAGGVGGNQSNGLAGDLTTSLLNYRMQVPMVDELARELGIDLSRGLNGLADAAALPLETTAASLGDAAANGPVARPAARAAKVVEKPLNETEKAEIQRLAGIEPDAA
jgi:uncharacterized membrane protein YqiK